VTDDDTLLENGAPDEPLKHTDEEIAWLKKLIFAAFF
jgi:hypothetical protein